MKMPKAYSYLRFSHPDQLKGDSLRRQTEGARDYAKRHGLELDASLSFRDMGVSGRHGKNVSEGALGAFIRAVEKGRVTRGSTLLVEGHDRLSRRGPTDALLQFQALLKLGINVVTLSDGMSYTYQDRNDIGKLLTAILKMHTAYEESEKKSQRLGAAWQNKRDKAQTEGRKLTARCPAWLELDRARDAFVIDKGRQKVVRRIFDMTIAGHGKNVIARRFNAEPVPTFGDSEGWHPSYVQKILESEAVCGVFQPMRMKDGERVPDGEPIADYFPAVVDRATFERAKRSRSARRIPVGRKGQNYSNLFTGLMFCGNCGSPMHYVNKGNGTKGGSYLVCSNARRAVSNCKAPSWRYGPVEALLILCMEELEYDALFPEITSSSRDALRLLEDSKLEKEAELAQTKRDLENITTLLIKKPDQPTLLARLDTTQARSDSLSAALRTLDAQIGDERERAKTAEHDFRQVQDGLQRLDRAHKAGGPELYDLRSRLHQLLKRTVQEITLHNANGPVFAPEHSGDLFGAIAVRFQSTNIGRTLYVEKGLKACRSVPIRNGKADLKRATTLKRAA